MGIKVQLRRQFRAAGFTMAEVVLALAVVAFGLIAVLGVLPIGLNTNRDNRDETIIKHDVEFWMNAIRGGRLSMDAFNHVEWVEMHAGGNVYRAEYAALARDGNPENASLWPAFVDDAGNAGLPPLAYRGTLKQASWRKDVLGWLSVPDRGTTHGVVKKYAKIRPLGSTLMNRLQGLRGVTADGQVDYLHEAGDRAFSYLIETRVKMIEPNFWEIKLIARWPIIEEGETVDKIKAGHGRRTFTSYINAPLERAWSRWDISKSERQVYDSLVPGELTTESALLSFHGAADPRDEDGVRTALKNLEAMGLVHKAGSSSYTPGSIYDSYGRFSLRSPPAYFKEGDNAGNFVKFSAPGRGWFQEMYFFKPAVADP